MFPSKLENQPILNIGCLGSVSHGKSTMVKLITGKSTQQHSKEKIKNITMKVGYANAKIYQDENNNYTTEQNESNKLVHHFSFVDCPGHQELIEVMMSGANLMDGGIVVVAGNQSIKSQPQLKQHLLTAKMIGIKKLIFVLNKLDLITSTLAMERKIELEDYLKEFNMMNPIIIPMSMNLGLNKEYLLQAIMEEFPPVKKENVNNFVFNISRSFDINKNGINPVKMRGGVVGGSVIQGELKIGENIIISPGQIKYDKVNNKWLNKPLTSKVISLKSENESLTKISCGGLTAVGLELDSFFTQNDKLKGQILHLDSDKNLVECVSEISCDIIMLEDYQLKNNETINLQIGCNSLMGQVSKAKKNHVDLILNKMIPIYSGIKILISKKDNGIISLLGVGSIKK